MDTIVGLTLVFEYMLCCFIIFVVIFIDDPQGKYVIYGRFIGHGAFLVFPDLLQVIQCMSITYDDP